MVVADTFSFCTWQYKMKEAKFGSQTCYFWDKEHLQIVENSIFVPNYQFNVTENLSDKVLMNG